MVYESHLFFNVFALGGRLNSELTHIYRELTGKAPREVLSRQGTVDIEKYIASFWNENHIIVLHALLEKAKKEAPSQSIVAPATATFEFVKQEFLNIWVDIQHRLDEYCNIWEERLEFKAYYPILKDHWVEQQIDGYRLKGKGDKEESRKLYQQTLQDVVVEGVRIFSLFQGTLIHLQAGISKEWQKECLVDELSKIMPLLEDCMREKEVKVFRNIPEFMNKKFVQLFVDHVNQWEYETFSTEKALFDNIAKKWNKSGKYPNGLIGFLHFFVEFMEAVLKKVYNYYNRKWRLYLRGVESSSSAVPQGVNP